MPHLAKMTVSLLLVLLLIPVKGKSADSSEKIRVYSIEAGGYIVTEKVKKSPEEWSEILEPDVFHIARQQGTEPAFSGKYWNHHEHGIYKCVACGQDLFHSETKFDSGTGWPSFYKPVAPENIGTETDSSFFMVRTEVHCSRCDSHLGHIFDDGPEPTGKRYCVNSAALKFKPLDK